MVFGIECAVFCLLMWLICFLGTGGDKKNLKSLRAYPQVVQDKVKASGNYEISSKQPNDIQIFVSNLVLFTIILFIFGIFLRTESFTYNFVALLLLGEIANLFDLVVIDMLWWRNSKRIRFSVVPEKELYKDMKNHIISFVKGAIMFLIASLIDGAILMCF